MTVDGEGKTAPACMSVKLEPPHTVSDEHKKRFFRALSGDEAERYKYPLKKRLWLLLLHF